MSSVGFIGGDASIPDVLRARPSLRAVFEHYGHHDFGGTNGPAETVECFARVHGVDLPALLAELNHRPSHPENAIGPSGAAGRHHPPDALADKIYRRFFKTGIVVVLTAGAVWGAWLLLQIALHGSFTVVSIFQINAHGHAQMFGWVGLFVMGFAYQALPRLKNTDLWRPDLASVTFYLMTIGIFVRVIAEPVHAFPLMRELAIAAGLAELAAIGLFVAIIVNTLRRSQQPYETSDLYILAALSFFLAQAIYDLGLLQAMTAGTSRAAVLAIVKTYQAALRDLQIHGFALLMILGLGQKMFPSLFGLREACPGLARIGLPLLVLAVMGEAGFLILMQRTGNHAWAGLLYACILLLAAVSVALTFRWGLLARPKKRDRSTKFVRAAVYWLHTSMLLLVLAPLYMFVLLPGSGAMLSESRRHAAEIGFSHAYYGAVRHAITVGFISVTIMGLAAKIVPTLKGLDTSRLQALWTPFLLINVGCALRVWLQIGTDFTAWVYPLVGVSGLLEVAGIAIWAVHLWRIMSGWRPVDEEPAPVPERLQPVH